MPKLNRYNDGGFVYGQWREVSRRVDPVTGDIIITERRDGSKDVKYDTRGVSWRKGYEDWLAAGNEGTMEDFKLEAEAWKRSQDRKEYDSQNRERRIKRNQEEEGGDDGDKPSDDPRPDGFVGDGPGGGGPDGGGGSGDVSRPGKDDNVSRPRRPGDADTPTVSILPKRPVSLIYDGDYEQVPIVPFVSRDPTNIAIPASQIAMTPEQMGEVILEEGEGVDEVLPDSRVESEYNLQTDSRTNRRGKEIVKQTYTDNINLLRDDGLSTINTKQVDRSKTGRPTRSRGRSVYQEFDSEGNRTLREVDRFDKGGLVSKNNNDMQEIRSYRRGGKTFPDLTGDGQVTRADILAGRGVIKRKKKKKSMAYGGKVKLMRQGGEVEYGLGGAVMGGINALMAGKGLAGAAGAAAKGFVTPGSGIAQGAQLAGNLAQKSNNPMLQNIGKMAGMASNFLPGGNPMGAIGAIGKMFQQKHGGYVSPKHRLF